MKYSSTELLDFPELPEGTDLRDERILLHCCCAPCSSAILEWMVGKGLRPGIFFSNSNIVPADEYEARREELKRYAASLGLETVDDEYDHASWLEAVKGLENEPERGSRCTECFRYRLLRAARYASRHGYTLLTTTLASSRWKNLAQVNAAGEWAVAMVGGLADSVGVEGSVGDGGAGSDAEAGSDVAPAAGKAGNKLRWWGRNWRKGGLQERRNCLIREFGMYNQNWCGCEFSRRDISTDGR